MFFGKQKPKSNFRSIQKTNEKNEIIRSKTKSAYYISIKYRIFYDKLIY